MKTGKVVKIKNLDLTLIIKMLIEIHCTITESERVNE